MRKKTTAIVIVLCLGTIWNGKPWMRMRLRRFKSRKHSCKRRRNTRKVSEWLTEHRLLHLSKLRERVELSELINGSGISTVASRRLRRLSAKDQKTKTDVFKQQSTQEKSLESRESERGRFRVCRLNAKNGRIYNQNAIWVQKARNTNATRNTHCHCQES